MSTPRVSVFVDGLNVMFRLRECGWAEFFDVGHFARRVAGGRTLTGVFYFRTRPSIPPIKSEEQYWAEVQHVQRIEGQVKDEFGRYVRFGYMVERWYGWEEKKTDVWLASQMVHDAAADAYDVAALATADADLVPAVEFARILGKEVELIVFPRAKPDISELLEHASWVKPARASFFRPYS